MTEYAEFLDDSGIHLRPQQTRSIAISTPSPEDINARLTALENLAVKLATEIQHMQDDMRRQVLGESEL